MEHAVEPAEIGLFYSHKADMGLRIDKHIMALVTQLDQ